MKKIRIISLFVVLTIFLSTICGCTEDGVTKKRKKKVIMVPRPSTSQNDSENNTTTNSSNILQDNNDTDVSTTTDNPNILKRRGTIGTNSDVFSGIWPPEYIVGENTTEIPGSAENDENWTLYWADEFNGTTLDKTYWTAETQPQYNYTMLTDRPENVRVENGNLVLTALREEYGGRTYTSGSITSSKKFAFQYGRLEFRAKLPYGQGVWPALWTMGDDYGPNHSAGDVDWPLCGEIDVMEMYGMDGELNKDTVGNRTTTCNMHWGTNKEEGHYTTGEYKYELTSGILADDYHIFAIEWTETEIVFFFDDIELRRVDITDPQMAGAFNKPHHIIMNVALRDTFEPYVNSTTPLPQSMLVDYVRVYKPAN